MAASLANGGLPRDHNHEAGPVAADVRVGVDQTRDVTWFAGDGSIVASYKRTSATNIFET